MTIKVEAYVTTPDYAHYPGQILIDVPYEQELLKSGAAIAMKTEPENATLFPAETATPTRKKK